MAYELSQRNQGMLAAFDCPGASEMLQRPSCLHSVRLGQHNAQWDKCWRSLSTREKTWNLAYVSNLFFSRALDLVTYGCPC